MKKKFYFATLVIALLTFTGCANDEYVGDQQNPGEQNGAIAFSTKSENTVRAGEIDGEKAAKRLNKQFWVYGTKTGNAITTPLVFDNYRVEYTGNTSDPYSPKGWEYVGKGGNDKPQTIKYWDYSASQYDFEAYSISNVSGEGKVARIPNNDRSEEKLSEGDYEVKEINDNGCASLYFAQKKTVSSGEYSNAVQLKFQSVLSKIRVGFYETIPGYSVKIDRFYPPQEGENPTDFANASNTSSFVAWCPNKAANHEHPFVVRYVPSGTPTVTTPAVTKVWNGYDKYISFDGTDGNTYTLNPKLTLGSNLLNANTTIGDSYSMVTWDQVDGDKNPIYTYFIPQEQLWNASSNESKVQPMKIKVDYTLTSDKDDSGEKIVVKGATAIVPAEYLKWAPNTAYSYVFRISDRTNGNTGTDPNYAGLYPITFDAVVTEMEDNRQDYLTTVSELSITATQEAGQFTGADEAAFEINKEIKVKVVYNNSGPQDITGNFVSNASYDKFEAAFVTSHTYDYNKSPEQNLNGNALVPLYYDNTGNVGFIKLEGKSAGYWIVKVTFRETTNGVNRDITKYAVLKVG